MFALRDSAATASPPVPDAATSTGLKRSISLPLLVLYGLGTTIGAGIYALTGAVAEQAGMAAPTSFLVAAGLAGLTGLGFAELAGRYPKAAGEAVFVDVAFGVRPLTMAVGVGVLASGLVSAATISVAFAGYVGDLVSTPEAVLTVGLLVVLGVIAAVGVRESVATAGVITAIELVGLVLVVWVARDAWSAAPARIGELAGFSGATVAGVAGGAFLAFFAFHGFEDMDSVAEETVNASVTMPRAIIATLIITTFVYVVVATTAVLTVPPADLASSDAPLSLIFERAGGRSEILSAIAGIAMVNGVLVQLVMAPRIVYGLTRLGLLPAAAGAVSARTGTPVRATVAAVAAVAALALTLELTSLARMASGITMAVFVAVNVSLIVIKRRQGPARSFSVPAWMPWLGTAASIALLVMELGTGIE
ncbi:MAG: amino acid permease [Actinomycetota bacterium]